MRSAKTSTGTTTRWAMTGVLATGLMLVAQAATAVPVPVQFLEFTTPLDTPTGFDPNGFPLPPDVTINLPADLPGVSPTAVLDGFGLQINLNCAIINENPGAGCQTSQPAGSSGFTLVVEVELVSVPDRALGQDSLIFMSAIEAIDTYSLDQVSVIDDPDPIAGFTFTPFTSAAIPVDPATTYYYLGFFMGLGDTATFRIDVEGDHSSAGTLLPIGWTAWVVPEPSTAVLVGLGLVILGRRRSR